MDFLKCGFSAAASSSEDARGWREAPDAQDARTLLRVKRATEQNSQFLMGLSNTLLRKHDNRLSEETQSLRSGFTFGRETTKGDSCRLTPAISSVQCRS
jgi:hypothetical protein